MGEKKEGFQDKNQEQRCGRERELKWQTGTALKQIKSSYGKEKSEGVGGPGVTKKSEGEGQKRSETPRAPWMTVFRYQGEKDKKEARSLLKRERDRPSNLGGAVPSGTGDSTSTLKDRGKKKEELGGQVTNQGLGAFGTGCQRKNRTPCSAQWKGWRNLSFPTPNGGKTDGGEGRQSASG